MIYSRRLQLFLFVFISKLLLPTYVVCFKLTKTTSAFVTSTTRCCDHRSGSLSCERHQIGFPQPYIRNKRKDVACFSSESTNEESITTTMIETTEPTTSTTTSANQSTNTQHASLGLTPELETIVTAFERIGDDKLRYKQLLYMANQLPTFDPTKQIPQNKVPGCLSTVYIDGYVERIENNNNSNDSDNDDNNRNEYRIYFVGDSDGLLTKGLVALLLRGLSGNTATQIQQVDPNFIQTAGIATSLTPGRNNGFLNMLAVMKRKALELEAMAKSQPVSSETRSVSVGQSGKATTNESSKQPKYDAIVAALQALKPEKVELVDTSYQHAGHREAGTSIESHFELYIVTEAFEGLNLIKRHKLVYMMLGDIMPTIHALNIKAKTPAEIQ